MLFESHKAMKDIIKFIKNHKKVYIIGTSTDIGKTYIGTMVYKELLKENQDFHVYKPIETGAEGSDLGPDTKKYLEINRRLKKDDINLYTIDEPCSPHLSEHFQQVKIDLKKVVSFISDKELAIIELAGGLLVPINKKETQLDLIKKSPHPVILVADAGLGTLNHVLLTIEVLRNSLEKLPIHVVLNSYRNESIIHQKNKEYLERNIELSCIANTNYK